MKRLVDYGSQKMEELIEKIECMPAEEFDALCERAEKDLQTMERKT